MSHANRSNQTEVNGDNFLVNDNDQINDTVSGKFFASAWYSVWKHEQTEVSSQDSLNLVFFDLNK